MRWIEHLELDDGEAVRSAGVGRISDFAINRTPLGFALLLLRGDDPTLRVDLTHAQAAGLAAGLAAHLADALREPWPSPPPR